MAHARQLLPTLAIEAHGRPTARASSTSCSPPRAEYNKAGCGDAAARRAESVLILRTMLYLALEPEGIKML